MTPKSITLEPFTEGDHFPGIPSLSIRVDGAIPASTLTTAVMRFYPAEGNGTAVQLSSATAGQITIVSAANWEISIPRQAIAGLTAGRWNAQIKLTNASAVKDTYISTQQLVLPTV